MTIRNYLLGRDAQLRWGTVGFLNVHATYYVGDRTEIKTVFPGDVDDVDYDAWRATTSAANDVFDVTLSVQNNLSNQPIRSVASRHGILTTHLETSSVAIGFRIKHYPVDNGWVGEPSLFSSLFNQWTGFNKQISLAMLEDASQTLAAGQYSTFGLVGNFNIDMTQKDESIRGIQTWECFCVPSDYAEFRIF